MWAEQSETNREFLAAVVVQNALEERAEEQRLRIHDFLNPFNLAI